MNPNDPSQQQPPAQQWNYTSGNLVEDGDQSSPESFQQYDAAQNGPIVAWSASEFVQHDKSAKWYFTLVGGALVLAAVVFVFTRQLLSVAVVFVMAALFGVYGATKPRTLQYEITPSGIQIGNKLYSFNAIKSFSVINEEGIPYIQLLLQKKLSVPLTVYVSPDQIDLVVDALGKFVPYDQKRRDFADKLSSRLRF